MFINNLDTIYNFIEEQFNITGQYDKAPHFFKFEALKRGKDGITDCTPKRSSSMLVRSWVVTSIEDFQKKLPQMKDVCDRTGARLYMLTDMKDISKVAFELSNYGNTLLKGIIDGQEVSPKNVMNCVNSITSKDVCSVHAGRHYLFDIDYDVHPDLQEDVKILYTDLQEIDDKLVVLNTPNGVHIITKRFNLAEVNIPEGVDVKINAMTLVYYYNEGEEKCYTQDISQS